MMSVGVIVSFFIGSVPFAYIAGRLKRVDIRGSGSGNVGATNAFRVLGLWFGIGVLLADLGKGFLAAAVVSKYVSQDPLVSVQFGIAAMLGHIFSLFLRFRGGKGVATWMGALLGVSSTIFGFAAGFFLLAVFLTKRVSVGSIASAFCACVTAFLCSQFSPLFFFSLFALVVIVVTHRENIKRLLSGTEPPLFGKKTPGR